MTSTLFGEVKEKAVETAPVEKRVDVWALLNSMKNHKEYIFDSKTEKEYNAWIVNISFSAFPEYLYHVDRMNTFHHIDKKMQYDYYFYALPKDKRYKKWIKKEKTSDDKYIEILANISNISLKKAQTAWSVMSTKQRESFVEKYITPDLKNSKKINKG